MRKRNIIVVCALLLLGVGVIGCGSSKAEKGTEVRDDSTLAEPIDTSTNEAADTEALRQEEARQEALRQDSILVAATPKMGDFIQFAKGQLGIYFRDGSRINTTLKSKGYTSSSKSVKAGNEEEGYWTAKSYNWNRSESPKIKIIFDASSNLITLKFDDEKSKDLFMESVISMGYKKGKSENDYGTSLKYNTNYYHPKGDYPMDVYVREAGKTIYLEGQIGG